MPATPENTVCGSSSLLVQVTVVPALTVTAAGENVKFVIDTWLVATAGPLAAVMAVVGMSCIAIVVADAEADAVCLVPHAASPTTAITRTAATAATRQSAVGRRR